MQYIVQNRQSLLDVAIQECGSLEAAFSLSRRNDIALSDDLAAGQAIEISGDDITNKNIVMRLSTQGAKPATAISEKDKKTVPYELGLGFMGIEIDFIIS